MIFQTALKQVNNLIVFTDAFIRLTLILASLYSEPDSRPRSTLFGEPHLINQLYNKYHCFNNKSDNVYIKYHIFLI